MTNYKVFGYATKRFNPLTGCSNYKNCPWCWARPMAVMNRGRFGYPQADPFSPTFHPERLSEPDKWRKPQIVATNFMGDWLDPNMNLEWIEKVLSVMADYPQHTFLTLTKQPQNYDRLVNEITEARYFPLLADGDYLLNMWHGLTITNQHDVDEKLPIFLQIPGKKWLSIEPMTGPISIKKHIHPHSSGFANSPDTLFYSTPIDQVIIGAMSGSQATSNPMELEWAEQVVSDCQAAGVPVFVKAIHINGKLSKDMNEWPESLKVRQLAWEESK